MIRPITLQQAQARYPHRFTMEHVPKWAREPMSDGRYYAPQYRSDAEWYANTRFPGEGGIENQCRYCESHAQTWPLGTSLAAPYRA